jgi:hypothetical protein
VPDKPNDKQPMFELSDCEDVSLHGNETTGSKLLRAERTQGIQAEGNRAGLGSDQTPNDSNGLMKSAGKWIFRVFTALLIAFFVKWLGWN